MNITRASAECLVRDVLKWQVYELQWWQRSSRAKLAKYHRSRFPAAPLIDLALDALGVPADTSAECPAPAPLEDDDTWVEGYFNRDDLYFALFEKVEAERAKFSDGWLTEPAADRIVEWYLSYVEDYVDDGYATGQIAEEETL